MAFNLKKVLKALLLSTNQPLSTKDIQAAFTRFHEQAAAAQAPQASAEVRASPAPGASSGGAAPADPGLAAEPGTPAEMTDAPWIPDDPELYGEVPSLVTSAQIREAMDAIALEFKASDDGLLLIEGASGFRVATQPRFARWIRILRQEPPPVRLSQSAIETLAVIAYRQPVTRTEIESIRGVSAEAGLNRLMEREMVTVVGRAELPGRPLQFGTTDRFLEFTGIKSLDELPASDVLTSRQIDDWLGNASGAAHTPNDADMGLGTDTLALEPSTGGESATRAAASGEPAAGDPGLLRSNSEPLPGTLPPVGG